MRRTPTANTLFYGDNLTILRDRIEDESIDLIYLDPPFNSNATYNVLFRSPSGEGSDSQIEAFGDTWQWGPSAALAYDEALKSGNSDVAEMLRAMRSFLGLNDMMAYLAMMAVRLIELHRVLKPNGSLYLHCDPTAGHYLKILLDAVFGRGQLRREIIWRSGWVSGFKTNTLNWVRNHDTIFYYLKSGENETTFNKIYKPHADDYKRRGGGENPKGIAIDDVWDDPELYSPNIKSFSTEKLGYPTQKPVALLERIISASSNEGELVLDPFCGCGTTIHAAEKLDRRWIGIDVTHLAVSLIQRRLTNAFPMLTYEVQGVPKDAGAAAKLAVDDPHQFQLWALSLVEATPWKGGRKGADQGVDGVIYFKVTLPSAQPNVKARTTDGKAIVSVKGGQNIHDTMVKDLMATVDQQQAECGVFITLKPPTRPMVTSAASAGFYQTEYKQYPKIQIVTIAELLDGKRPDLPFIDLSAFRAAKQETGKTQQGDLNI